MGDDAAFFNREGVARPALVAKLGELDPRPDDPTLLARLIDQYAGQHLDFSAVGLECRVRDTRREALKQLRSIQKHARLLAELGSGPIDVSVAI